MRFYLRLTLISIKCFCHEALSHVTKGVKSISRNKLVYFRSIEPQMEQLKLAASNGVFVDITESSASTIMSGPEALSRLFNQCRFSSPPALDSTLFLEWAKYAVNKKVVVKTVLQI